LSSRAAQAALAAAAAASQINAKLGIQSAGQPPVVGTPAILDVLGSFGAVTGQNENITVPDNMVGMCK